MFRHSRLNCDKCLRNQTEDAKWGMGRTRRGSGGRLGLAERPRVSGRQVHFTVMREEIPEQLRPTALSAVTGLCPVATVLTEGPWRRGACGRRGGSRAGRGPAPLGQGDEVALAQRPQQRGRREARAAKACDRKGGRPRRILLRGPTARLSPVEGTVTLSEWPPQGDKAGGRQRHGV